MRALMVSKALVAAAYRQKLVELSRLGVEVTAVVPPVWREDRSAQPFEPDPEPRRYELALTPMRFNGHFHLHYYPDLPRLIRECRPDLVHVDEEPFNLATFLASLAAGRLEIPSLFFSWQNIPRRYPPPFSAMERAVYRWSRYALAGSEEAAEVLRGKGYSGPLAVVPQFGVDPDLFYPDGTRHEGFQVGFFNRLTPGKAPLLALDAFRQLPRDARLWVVGDGPLRPHVADKMACSGLGDRVTLRSRIASGEMPELIRSMDAVILPSVSIPSWKEQFGRVLIEAMACGVPVVGSTSGEIPRVVGDAGLIVPEGDGAALADALRTLYFDPALRRELGRRGRQRVLERFTHAQVAEQTYRAYREALGIPLRR